MWISISVLFKIPYQRNLTQKILGFLWIFVGYKFFLEEILLLLFGSNLNSFAYIYLLDYKNLFFCVLGSLCVLVGLLLSINFAELKTQIKNLTWRKAASGTLTILSIIFFDKNYLIFNFEKKIFNLQEEANQNKIPYLNANNLNSNSASVLGSFTNFQEETDYFDSFFTGENLFKFFLILINLLPLVLNSAWADLVSFKSKSNFLLKNLIPNPVFISLLTLLLQYFLVDSVRSEARILTLYSVVNFTCYLIFVAFLAYELFVTRNLSFWAIFYFVLIAFNFVAMYFFNVGLNKNITFAEEAKAIPDSDVNGKEKNYLLNCFYYLFIF